MVSSRSSKKKRSKLSSKATLKKKSRRDKSRKHHRRSDPVSSDDNHSIDSVYSLSSTSVSDYRSKKNKSKKRSRHDYSVSSRSDSSYSDSMSASDSDYGTRKSRPRSRLVSKTKEKRTQKRSMSPDSDLDLGRDRKRKRSKRYRDKKPTKKLSKKKHKKHSSVTSSSSATGSCSTCRSKRRDSISDRKPEGGKIMLDKAGERLRDNDLYKAKKRRIARSPSCSSCSRSGDHNVSISLDEEVLAAQNNTTRRLRSVIIVAETYSDKEDQHVEKDLNKEEIVYDQADYPSPRSVDSFDGESKRDSDYQSNKKNQVEGKVTVPAESDLHPTDQNNAANNQSNEVQVNDVEEKKQTDVSVTSSGLDGEQLESILRKKALENLRKFRGTSQAGKNPAADLIIEKEGVSNQLLGIGGSQSVQNNSPKPSNSGVTFLTKEISQSNRPKLKRDFSLPTQVQTDHPDGDPGKVTGLAKQSAIQPSDGASEVKSITASAVDSKPVSSTAVNLDTGTPDVSSSTTMQPTNLINSNSEEHSLQDQPNDARDGSQFEKKTMSVLRGGERVQVSYKVYIPKKAPALARRHLRQ